MEIPRRNHHIIPKHYLKGFNDEDNPQFIWVYTKGKPYTPGKQHFENLSPCLVSLRIAGAEMDYYAEQYSNGTVDYDTVEKKLEREEQPAQPVIDKLRQFISITPEEKNILAEYIILLYKRVAYHRSDPNGLYDSVFQNTFERYYGYIAKELAESHHNDSKQQYLLKFRDTLQKIQLNFPETHPPNHIYNKLLFLPYGKVIKALKTMNWTFVINQTASPFIASDNPVFFTRSAGLAKSDLTFPISKHVALISTWDSGYPFFKTVNEKLVKTINRRTVSLATKYVYSPIDTEWITTMANRERYPHRELIRI